MTSIIVVLVVWLVPNIWCTFLVSRSELPQKHKAILIIGIWLIPIIGVTMAYWDIPRGHQLSSAALPRAGQGPGRPERAPDEIETDESGPFSMVDHLSVSNGLPVLNWRALDEWAKGNLEAIELGRRAWLLHLRDALPPPLHLHETSDALVLSPFSRITAKSAAHCVANVRERIGQLLGGIAERPEGKHSILIVMNDQENFRNYVSIYPSKANLAASARGVFINLGCPHLVTVNENLWTLEPVIAREMTRGAIEHLELPRWLEEGIAVSAEKQIAISGRDDGEVLATSANHRAFWNARRFQEFWAGKCFNGTDEANALSRDLARSIVDHLSKDRASFVEFATNASRDDGGAAAALGLLKQDLGDIATLVLGLEPQPEWSPNPENWELVAG
jgi:hypothetical protein